MQENFSLYEKFTPYVLGFHGCDQSVANQLLSTDTPSFKQSSNGYDWLGGRMYFWENDPNRALAYILEVQKKEPKRIKNPTVVGAVLELGHCLNLVENRYINLLKDAFKAYKTENTKLGIEMPQNKPTSKNDHDKLFRHLDCAVIEFMHALMGEEKPFDSVRGMFIEGGAVYEGAGFHEKTHIQIAIRNPNMIKGYFIPINSHII